MIRILARIKAIFRKARGMKAGYEQDIPQSISEFEKNFVKVAQQELDSRLATLEALELEAEVLGRTLKVKDSSNGK